MADDLVTQTQLPAPVPDQRSPLLKRLWCQNPCYIISAGCVVHGIGQWYQAGHDTNPWALMALIGSYILMMATAAFGVVKYGKVWDDARSIFVVILLLFVELTLSFDGTLLRDPPTGRWLLIVGLCLALLVTEALLFGLRIRLRSRYRIPYYLMMTQLFLYPLFLTPVVNSGDATALGWRLFLFSPIAAVTILSLLPAVRGGAAYIDANGTPWKWPLYPWTIFVTLIGCLCVRAFAVCAAFDPVVSQTTEQAMRLDTVFNGYFMMPILVAIAVLVLEVGLNAKPRRRQQLCGIAMLMVAGSVGLSAIAARSFPQARFLAVFTQTLATPVYVALCVATAFAAYAFVRKAAFAERALHLAIGAHLVIGPATNSFATRLDVPPVWPLLLLAGLHIALGCWRHQHRRLVAGVLGAIATLHVTVLAHQPPGLRMLVTVHLSWLTVLIAGIVFKDELLRSWSAAATVLFAGAALLFGPDVQGMPQWLPIVYASGLAVFATGCAIVLRDWQFVVAATLTALFASGESIVWLIAWVRRRPDGKGIVFYVVGLIWFVLAIALSGAKARRMKVTDSVATKP